MMAAITRTGKQLFRMGLSLTGTLWLAACGSLNSGSNAAPPFRDPTLSLQSARDAVVIGTSTQADTLAALGPATEIHFDSGYAVWVYRAKSSGSETDKAELVILFAPSGIVKKTRLRPVGRAG